MPLYKSGLDMWKKYQAKFNPTVVSTRLTDVQQIALDRAQEGMNAVATVRDLVRPVLDEYGIAGGMRATYLAFATALYKHVIRQKGDVAKNTSSGLKSYYVTAYGLDPNILDELIQVVCGWVIAY